MKLIKTRIITLLVTLGFVTSALGAITPLDTDDRLTSSSSVSSYDAYQMVGLVEEWNRFWTCQNTMWANTRWC